MKLLLLMCDLVISSVYALLCYWLFPAQFGGIMIIMLFFLAVRVLALSVHDAFSIGNLLLLVPLRQYQPVLLVVMYLLYMALYFFLTLKEQKQKALTEENTRLQIETQQARHYRQLQERFENQIALNTRLQERERIAQDIHDVLGHSVTASVFQLEAAKKIMAEQPEKARQMVSQAADNLRQGMEQIRSTVHQMKAQAPDMNRQEMDTIIERFRRDSGLTTHYQVEGEGELSNGAWDVLHSNLTEALSNVMRHAQASQVRVTLQILPGVARLEVHDDGLGAKDAREGMGISGMRSRALERGGSLMVRGDKGMTVITLLPREGKEV